VEEGRPREAAAACGRPGNSVARAARGALPQHRPRAAARAGEGRSERCSSFGLVPTRAARAQAALGAAPGRDGGYELGDLLAVLARQQPARHRRRPGCRRRCGRRWAAGHLTDSHARRRRRHHTAAFSGRAARGAVHGAEAPRDTLLKPSRATHGAIRPRSRPLAASCGPDPPAAHLGSTYANQEPSPSDGSTIHVRCAGLQGLLSPCDGAASGSREGKERGVGAVEVSVRVREILEMMLRGAEGRWKRRVPRGTADRHALHFTPHACPLARYSQSAIRHIMVLHRDRVPAETPSTLTSAITARTPAGAAQQQQPRGAGGGPRWIRPPSPRQALS
jgi:hypothetical protein